MKSFTDIFIRHPVLAIVVNLVIVLVGLACRNLAASPAVPNAASGLDQRQYRLFWCER